MIRPVLLSHAQLAVLMAARRHWSLTPVSRSSLVVDIATNPMYLTSTGRTSAFQLRNFASATISAWRRRFSLINGALPWYGVLNDVDLLYWGGSEQQIRSVGDGGNLRRKDQLPANICPQLPMPCHTQLISLQHGADTSSCGPLVDKLDCLERVRCLRWNGIRAHLLFLKCGCKTL